MKGMKSALMMSCLVVIVGCATGTKHRVPQEPSEKARTYYEQGVTRIEEGEFDEALSALKRAVRAYPRYGDAYYNMGIAYQKMGGLEEAIDAYQKAIEINPGDAAAHNNLGNVYLRQGRLGEAIAELDQALKIDPTYGLAHHNMALACYLAKMYHRALEHLNELKRLGMSPEADLMEAVAAALNLGKSR